MKCPLLFLALVNNYTRRQDGDADCLKEECAWWEDKIGKCCVLRIWIALQDIHEVLHDITKELTMSRSPRG